MRVPLDQSGAAAAARWIARSGLRDASARVRRVSRVANTNASGVPGSTSRGRARRGTGGRRARRAPSSPRCRTAARGAGARSAGDGARGAPGRRRCAGCARSVRRRSMCSPWRSRVVRRVRLSGGATSRRDISRYRCASSSGSSASKRLRSQQLLVAGAIGTGISCSAGCSSRAAALGRRREQRVAGSVERPSPGAPRRAARRPARAPCGPARRPAARAGAGLRRRTSPRKPSRTPSAATGRTQTRRALSSTGAGG